MISNRYDIVIIGGGIVGLATAMSLSKYSNYKIIVIEAEEKIAAHQTGNNSGVIHSGLYYKPGSLKAQNCTEGRELMYKFCEEYNIRHERCGKLVVAVNENEIPALNELEKRGTENGLTELKRLKKEELKEYEPFVNGIEGLFVPQTGIVDYIQVSETYSKIIREKGGEIKTKTKFFKLKKENSELILETSSGVLHTKYLVNCGGLYSDRIAKACGLIPNVKIIPFRGEYYQLIKLKENMVKNLIYPVPDPKFPFLGVHFTRMINGGVEAGPNAVLAFKREGYKRSDISVNDLLDMLTYKGFWLMASKYYKMGFEEMYRSFNKDKFVNSLRKLIPYINNEDVCPGGSGVRAQALDNNGKLVDDFRIIEAEYMIHVLNAPSPAATASISIGNKISKMVIENFSQHYNKS